MDTLMLQPEAPAHAIRDPDQASCGEEVMLGSALPTRFIAVAALVALAAPEAVYLRAQSPALACNRGEDPEDIGCSAGGNNALFIARQICAHERKALLT